MDTFFIRPACPGADIRDPQTGDRLAEAGESKPRDPYWIGLEIRGDVITGEPETVPAEPLLDPDPPATPKPDKKA